MNIKELQQLFMAKFDCYADIGGEDGPPAMTEKRFLEVISQNFQIEDNTEHQQLCANFNKVADLYYRSAFLGTIHDGA